MQQQTAWQCEHSFGGHVFETKIFDTREEAENFAEQLTRVAPEGTFTIAPVLMNQIWN